MLPFCLLRLQEARKLDLACQDRHNDSTNPTMVFPKGVTESCDELCVRKVAEIRSAS